MSGKNNGTIDVSQVAVLARLEIPAGQTEKLQAEMEAIVGYVEMLSELDVDGIEPTAHAVDRVNVMREDVATQPRSRQDMLANAPGVVDGNLIKVPQVLPGEGSN